MPTSSYKERVRDAVLSMLWSLWAEVGAGGWERRHGSTAIDVEPLIIATSHPSLQRADRRLLAQALDWSTTNVRLVSAVRLRNLLPGFGHDLTQSFTDFGAAVNRETNANWPMAGKAREPKSSVSRLGSNHTPVADLTRPSLLQMRLRACWGVSVRAEIVRLLLAEPPHLFLGVSQLAARAAFGRHNVAGAVEMMIRAGILRERGAGRWHQFQLSKRDPAEGVEGDPWESLFGPLPATSPDWVARLKFTLALLDFSEVDIRDPLVRAAESARLRREHAQDIARNGIVFAIRQPGPTGKEPIKDFEDQALKVLLRWSGEKN